MIGRVFRLHYLSLLAVVGSIFGSLLLFLIGTFHVIEAFLLFLRLQAPEVAGKANTEAVATVLESFDNYLVGFVLLYFAYSLYFLVTFPEERAERFGTIKLPPALQVADLAEMKKTILTIVVVSMSIYLLRETLIAADSYQWTDLFVPISIVAVALAIRLIGFNADED